jgi:hypothetical protein
MFQSIVSRDSVTSQNVFSHPMLSQFHIFLPPHSLMHKSKAADVAGLKCRKPEIARRHPSKFLESRRRASGPREPQAAAPSLGRWHRIDAFDYLKSVPQREISTFEADGVVECRGRTQDREGKAMNDVVEGAVGEDQGNLVTD